MHDIRLSGGEGNICHFTAVAARSDHHFYIVQRAKRNRQIAGRVVNSRGMIGDNFADAGKRRIQCGRNPGGRADPADIVADYAPRYGLIAEIIAGGIVTGGMHGERPVCG
ncbi:MAG: hypothetical protein ALAOOOJD_01028 [bacterium]|nr:hypothetical protein [bacterium]